MALVAKGYSLSLSLSRFVWFAFDFPFLIFCRIENCAKTMWL